MHCVTIMAGYPLPHVMAFKALLSISPQIAFLVCHMLD